MSDLGPSGMSVDVPATIHLASSAFEDQGSIPATYTCEGRDVSPPLAWRGIPSDTVELAVVCEDIDAGDGAVAHWLVAGLDSAILGVGEGDALEGAALGDNDLGDRGYTGPCPPPGEEPRRYVFTILAASHGLSLESGFTARELREALRGRTIAKGELTGLYRRRSA